jgi:hypothetical protein
MMRLLERLVGPPRVISDRDGRRPYLSRWYLLGRFLGGSADGRAFGRLPVNLFLHRFHRSDDAGELHSHPWAWSVSFILKGGYSEERRQSDDAVVRRQVRPFTFNVIRGTDFHRVDIDGDCWTLFLAGPKLSTWYFWNRDTKMRIGWRAFCGLGPGEWEPDARIPDDARRAP